MKLWPVIVVSVALLASARPGHANQDKTAAARAHAEEATKSYNLGDFEKAIAEYRAAYSALPDPAFLYNIAQAYRLSNRHQQALFFYRSFLRAEPDAHNRDEVQDRIRKLLEQIKAQESLSNSPPTSTIAPATPHAEPVRADAPEAVHAEPADAASQRTSAIAPRTTASPGASASASAELVLTPPPRKPVYKKWWLWTGVSAIAVGAALGVGLGIGLTRPQSPSAHFGNTEVF